MWTVEPTKEELSQKLNTATKSMAHMNRLLHETEATNAVLMEQITVRTHQQYTHLNNSFSFLHKSSKNFNIILNID